MLPYMLVPLLAAALASGAEPPPLANRAVLVAVGGRGVLAIGLTLAPHETAALTLAPSFADHARCSARLVAGRRTATLHLSAGPESAFVEVRLLDDGCRLAVTQATPGWRGFSGRVSGSESPLYAARIALDAQGNPTVHGGGDVLDIAVGRASNRRMNAVYATSTFRGVLLDGPATVDLRPHDSGYAFRFAGHSLRIRTLDVWPLLGWRPAYGGSTYGHPEASQPHVIPREWMAKHRPFPWPTLSPVQLPFTSITDPHDFDRVKEQVDFLAANLRDWGFSCFGEWPLTQHNPEYAPPAVRQAYLDGNRRTCAYAHSKGIRVLRWVTDPDLGPNAYPEMHADFLKRGGFSHEPGSEEWLLDYTNPEVQQWIEQQYADLGATGPDFYWIDNNHPTRPLHDPTRFPPEAFREFYLAIQRGLLATGRNDILMRSGASEWADYSAAGILDVYAPGPDVQNDWTEQQLYVAGTMAREDYLCHFNLWRRGIDDYFPAGPQTIDQTRAMATLLGLTGIGFTTTDIGLPKIPPDRLTMLRQLVPLAVTRPMDLYRFSSGALPRWWVLNQQDGERAWQVAGLFNWGLRTEETHSMPLDQLGLDPAQEYLVYDFWSQREVGRFRGALAFRVAPTTGRALAIHPVGDRPFIVATDRHVTMGASELANRKWDAKTRTLSADFVAGVAGQRFTLTFYSPPKLRPVQATVAGAPEAVEPLEDGLYRIGVPTSGPTAAIRIVFEPVKPPAPRERRRPPRLANLYDLSDAAMVRRLASPESIAALLARARSGERIVLVNAADWSPDLARLQEGLGLAWGWGREPRSEGWWVATGDAEEEVPSDLLFRSSCIGLQPNLPRALIRPIGRGLIVAGGSWSGYGSVREQESQLQRFLDKAAQVIHGRPKDFLAKCTSTVGPFEVNAALTEGTGPLRISRALAERSLSFHFRRLSMSIIQSEWGVPRVSLFVNGTECPHRYNPCRPESPPQEWDSLYFAIPKGVLRFDGSDRVTIRSAVSAKDAEAFRTDLQAGLELAVEDAAIAGQPGLVPVPAAVLAPSAMLDALLGLDGGVRFLARGGGTEVTFTGTPYNGWPLRPGGVTHCLFDGGGFEVAARVPKGSVGVLEAYVYDYEGVRTEDLSFEDRPPVTVDHFANGKWLRFPFSENESADGELRLRVGNPRGGNAVLSRLRVCFDDAVD